MECYCLSCKRKTESVEITKEKNPKGKGIIIKAKCAVCGNKKCKFNNGKQENL